ncbi:MAG: hypothetical protein ACKVKF_26355 [Rhodobacterales bacterium]
MNKLVDVAFLDLEFRPDEAMSEGPLKLRRIPIKDPDLAMTTYVRGNGAKSYGADSREGQPTFGGWEANSLCLESPMQKGKASFILKEADNLAPETRLGWSGAPIMMRQSDGEDLIVGMWRGGGVAKPYQGLAICAERINEELNRVIGAGPMPRLVGQWSPYPFDDEVRGRSPSPVEHIAPVTGQVQLIGPGDDRTATHVRTTTGFAPVCGLSTAAGSVIFGIASARMTIQVFGMKISSHAGDVDMPGSRAIAEHETNSGTESTWYIKPRKKGDALRGNALAPSPGAGSAWTEFAELEPQAERGNSFPEVVATLQPDFQVIALRDKNGREVEDDDLNRFKLQLSQKLMERHKVQDGCFPMIESSENG